MKVILVLFSLILISSLSVVYAQEMKFYNNEKYDFSFEIPTDWSYQEDVVIDIENIEEVFFFPEEFSMENADDDKTMMDVAAAMMGWTFQFESPLIGIDYRNIPTSKISDLTEANIKKYFLDETMELDPDTRITESYSETHSYGWEVGIISTIDLDLGYGSPMLYKQEEKLFVFKDREVYGVAYGSLEKYYDEYKSTYDHVMNTITIKSVVNVQTSEEIEPEIQSIFDDIGETVSDVESMEIAGKNVDEMTDEELLERFQELMSYDEELKPPIEALRDETAAAEFMEKMDAWYAEVKQIIKIMTDRGWEISPVVIIREDGSKVEVLDFSDPDNIKLNEEIFGDLDIELIIKSPEKLVEEYNFLIDKFDKLGTNSEQLVITQELIDEINSDLERLETIVISLQNQGYDGMAAVDLVDEQIIGTISFFDKYTLEPLFKRQIPSGAVNIFGSMGLIKEFEGDGVPFSFEDKVTMLKTSSALIGTVATFSGPSDPNYEIGSGMVLAAIGAYHPSVDNLKNSESELLSSKEIPSLKVQEMSGVAPLDIICKEGLQKIFKSTDKSPSCVKPTTATKLIERGWAWDLK